MNLLNSMFFDLSLMSIPMPTFRSSNYSLRRSKRNFNISFRNWHEFCVKICIVSCVDKKKIFHFERNAKQLFNIVFLKKNLTSVYIQKMLFINTRAWMKGSRWLSFFMLLYLMNLNMISSDQSKKITIDKKLIKLCWREKCRD